MSTTVVINRNCVKVAVFRQLIKTKMPINKFDIQSLPGEEGSLSASENRPNSFVCHFLMLILQSKLHFLRFFLRYIAIKSTLPRRLVFLIFGFKYLYLLAFPKVRQINFAWLFWENSIPTSHF